MFTYLHDDKKISSLLDLSGKVAFVTGGAKGIGLAIARRLAEAGAAVAVTDIDVKTAEADCAEIRQQFGAKALALELNIADRDAIRGAVKTVEAELGPVDIFVNNAGIFPFMDTLDINDEAFDRLMNINLRGTFTCGREVAAHMVDSGRGGVIINMSSISSNRASGNASHYVTSKFAINGMTQGFARDLAGRGVRVLAVAPTLVNTPGIQDASLALGDFVKAIPMGRAATPDDIARVVLFAASDMASFMTGSVLYVDGGHLTTG